MSGVQCQPEPASSDIHTCGKRSRDEGGHSTGSSFSSTEALLECGGKEGEDPIGRRSNKKKRSSEAARETSREEGGRTVVEIEMEEGGGGRAKRRDSSHKSGQGTPV